MLNKYKQRTLLKKYIYKQIKQFYEQHMLSLNSKAWQTILNYSLQFKCLVIVNIKIQFISSLKNNIIVYGKESISLS